MTMRSLYEERINSEEWWKTRKNVFRRDNYTCQMCGKTDRDGTLHAHHILYDDSQFFNPEYIITLCSECHHDVHEFHSEYMRVRCEISRWLREEMSSEIDEKMNALYDRFVMRRLKELNPDGDVAMLDKNGHQLNVYLQGLRDLDPYKNSIQPIVYYPNHISCTHYVKKYNDSRKHELSGSVFDRLIDSGRYVALL